MKTIAVDRVEITNIAVDRAENDKYCGGSSRKLEIVLWSAQAMTNIALDRAENYKYYCGLHRKENILLCIAQKMKHIDVDRI